MILRLILGDQLNYNHSWFRQTRDDVRYVMMEVKQETSYVLHHIQKVVGFFMAMRNFAAWLSDSGHKVHYIRIDQDDNDHSFPANLGHLIKAWDISSFEYQEPDEYRVEKQLKEFCKNLNIPWKMVSTEHFLTSRSDLSDFFKGKKMLLMESFYRHMRKKHHILMDKKGNPSGGQWNYDKQNRERLGPDVDLPGPLLFHHDTGDLIQVLNEEGIETFGNVDPHNFHWPVSRDDSLRLLQFFTDHLLPRFGTYQDAMVRDQWSLFHSRLSFSLNTKMLHPAEVVKKVVQQYDQRPQEIDIAQVEGFVRQVIGWREYMRGIYWKEMPGYEKLNFFNHSRKLPGWYWTGETKMNCLKQSVAQSLKHAYAHHIQRLMVTGNFALLAGIDPDEVDNWYLGIYIDALQWVEITNTRGMSQFADGGIVGTKPYAASANYIDKMSDYCGHCHYDKRDRSGENACPLNSLYWRFYHLNRDKLEKNPRIGMMYRTWDRMDKEKRAAILNRAEEYIENLGSL